MVVLAALSFLMFLWFGYGPVPEAAKASQAWRHITLNNWMAQAITLASLALRIAVSVQTTTCTSMIAALFLERHRTRRSQVPWLSVMRSINDGPLKLIQVILSPRSFAVFGYIELWSVILMAVVTLLLQFSSTILLSDLRDFVIVGDVNNTQFPGLFSVTNDNFSVTIASAGYLNYPPVYAIFGEAQSGFNASPDTHGLSHTGLLQRGLLPLPERDERTSVRKFDGNAMVMNSKVACVRPQIDARYYSEGDELVYNFYGVLEGRLKYASSLRDAQVSAESLCDSPECQEAPFSCYLPSTYAGWQSNYCFVGSVGGQDWGWGLNSKWDPSDEPWSRHSSMALVFSTNMRIEDWSDETLNNPLPDGSPNGEWESYEIKPGRFVNATLCFPAFHMGRNRVSMTASSSLREPSTNWSLTSIENHSTGDIQKYMGASTPQGSHGDRGIMDMRILGIPDDGPPSNPAHAMFQDDFEPSPMNITAAAMTPATLETTIYGELSSFTYINSTRAACYECGGIGWTTNIEVGLLFNDIITQTGRAGYAFQSLITLLSAEVYNSYLESLDLLQEGQMTTTTISQAPGSCSRNGCPGFLLVTALIVVHLLYVAAITIMYIKRVQYSRYGSIWHTISQLVSKELKDTMEQGNDASDKRMNNSMKKEGNESLLQLGRSENGRIEVSKYSAELGRSTDFIF